LREAHPLEGRSHECDLDEGSIDIVLCSKAIGIERANHRAKLFE